MQRLSRNKFVILNMVGCLIIFFSAYYLGFLVARNDCVPFNLFLNSMYPNIWTNSEEFQDIETALQDFSTLFILCKK